MQKQTVNRRRACAVGAAVAGAAMLLASGARAQQVYIGGGDNSPGAFDGYLNDPGGWTYVRANANGYYINNFALNTNTGDATQNSKLSRMAGLFTNKNAFYETDLQRTTDNEDKVKIDILRQFFNVSYATLNKGWTASRISALQWRAPRPVLAMVAPWEIGGDINSTAGAADRDSINHMSGSSTDGPMGLWQTNQGNMHGGSYTTVKYSHFNGKIAMVMIAPYQSGSGSNFLSLGETCVRQHESAGAKPDIWAIEYYAAQIQQYPVTPEQVNGQPAGTLTGMAYWLIHHVKDPAHWASLSLPSLTSVRVRAASAAHPTAQTDAALFLPVTRSAGSFCAGTQVVNLTLHNSSTWLDLCPVLQAKVIDPAHHYDVRFRVAGKDVTREMTTGDGLSFINALRLWPGHTQQVQMIVRNRREAAMGNALKMADVQIALRPNPSAKHLVNQIVRVHVTPRPLPALLASSK